MSLLGHNGRYRLASLLGGLIFSEAILDNGPKIALTYLFYSGELLKRPSW
jgi:hypothetical protein